MTTITARKYRDFLGRVLFVTDGISRGDSWFTGYHKKNGTVKRLSIACLPIRRSREQAQADLDRLASERLYPEVQGS